MSPDEKDRIAGETRREYREAKQELAALKKKASVIGEFLRPLSELFIREPESIIFVHESYNPRFTSKVLLNDAHLAELTAAKIRELTSQIRDQIVKIEDLRRRVAELEGEDPEKN